MRSRLNQRTQATSLIQEKPVDLSVKKMPVAANLHPSISLFLLVDKSRRGHRAENRGFRIKYNDVRSTWLILTIDFNIRNNKQLSQDEYKEHKRSQRLACIAYSTSLPVQLPSVRGSAVTYSN